MQFLTIIDIAKNMQKKLLGMAFFPKDVAAVHQTYHFVEITFSQCDFSHQISLLLNIFCFCARTFFLKLLQIMLNGRQLKPHKKLRPQLIIFFEFFRSIINSRSHIVKNTGWNHKSKNTTWLVSISFPKRLSACYHD